MKYHVKDFYKVIIFAIVAISLILFLKSNFYQYAIAFHPSATKETVYITDVYLDEDGGALYFDLYDNPSCLWFRKKTKILDKNGKKAVKEDFKIGQKIEFIAKGEVIYEPIDTFMECYQIKILE